LTDREDSRGTLLELLIERVAVIDQAIPPAVSETAEELLEIAKDTIEGVRDWASDTAERARGAVTPPKKKKRSKLPLLVVLLGLGALAFYILRKRSEAVDALIAGDFDAAADEDRVATNGERAPLSTPGT
jgi:hypothetical protein